MFRHTKIIATLGPATDSEAQMDALIGAGVDIFRINFSHGNRQTQRGLYERLRGRATAAKRDVAVMQDLAGPKIRVGRLTQGKPVSLVPGAELRIATGDFAGDVTRVSTTYAGLARAVSPGDQLLLDDAARDLAR